MLKLNGPGPAFRHAYAAARRKTFNDRKAKLKPDANTETGLSWANAFVDYLQANLDELLTGEPPTLRRHIRRIRENADFRKFIDYCANRPRSNGKNPPQDPKLESLLALVNGLFSYKALGDDETFGARALLQQYEQRICPYCQMHHVNFYVRRGKSKLQFSPALDHFYPASKYAFLAVSLYNLVPACEQCNSRVKSAHDPLACKLSSPFESTRQLAFRSNWHTPAQLDDIRKGGDFVFRFVGRNRASHRFADFFHLGARYEWYRPELLDLAKRYRRFMGFSDELRDAIDHVGYLLSFETAEADRRVLGTLLKDAAQRMVARYGVTTQKSDTSA